MIVILNGSEVRVMSTRSGFSAASVLAVAFFAAFESVFAFALRANVG